MYIYKCLGILKKYNYKPRSQSRSRSRSSSQKRSSLTRSYSNYKNNNEEKQKSIMYEVLFNDKNYERDFSQYGIMTREKTNRNIRCR